METFYSSNGDKKNRTGPPVIRRPEFAGNRFAALSWLDVRVFYVRITNFTADDSSPESLTLRHFPASPETVVEVNGARCAMDSDAMSCTLRKDRVDKESEEATFITTDSIRVSGGVRFHVFDREDLVISGALEMSDDNGFSVESTTKSNAAKKWVMKCESATGLLKGKRITRVEPVSPTIEVYVAGSFSGTPLILTKTLVISPRKKHRKVALRPIPEYDHDDSDNNEAGPESLEDNKISLDFQVAEYKNYRSDSEEEYDGLYWTQSAQYMEGEDGELSWFNAGVRVGVGIGLGVCLGIGIGVGLLVRTYHTTARTFKRRLL
ncbi:uncharacterized protein At1g01500-like [Andrographis paniculata]|uniref:uncharacterized protein At1g01500-like n=1 Tax=Andrographis paniculata TaxID=175694 RepID=UPI0021E78784|nr:uncharacterized protein At1g01500-like [Andrographis paniculata]XP_051150872.1 uncharacterized protein At1g01500-like [Andrographis paniculata]